MKSGQLSKWSLGLLFFSLGLTGGSSIDSSNAALTSPITAPQIDRSSLVQPVADELQPSPDQPAVSTSAAPTPTQVLAGEKPPPAQLRLMAPTLQLIKLVSAGVDESVMLSFVTNSPSTFNLGADELIYLTDIGVPGSVLSAALRHDQELQALQTTAAVAPAPQQGGPPPTTEDAPPQVPPQVPPEPDAAYSPFYDELAPYGTWVDVAGYGPCWQPSVAVVNPGWQPYFDGGQWIYTDCGWYWLSDYSWGWAPFHYGRWFRYPGMGWCWAPDTVWGPSWVCWRYNDVYCGWAPLPPGTCFTFGVGFTFHGHRVHDGDDCGLGRDHYRFVAWGDFHDRHLRGHGVPPGRADEIFPKTVVVNRMVQNRNVVINQGIAPERVATVTHREVPRVMLHQMAAGRPGLGRAERFDPRQRNLTVYRPQMPQPSAPSARLAGTALPAEPSRMAPSARPAQPEFSEGFGVRSAPPAPSSRDFADAPPPQSSAPRSGRIPAPQQRAPMNWQAPQRPTAPSATPWLNGPAVQPMPVQRSPGTYVPRPAYTPSVSAPRSGYAGPASVPNSAPVRSGGVPARPAMSPTPRAAPAPSMSPARSVNVQARPAPSAPPASSGNRSSRR